MMDALNEMTLESL